MHCVVLRRQIHAVNRVCVIVLLLLCACVLGGFGRRIDLAAVLHEANAAYTQGD